MPETYPYEQLDEKRFQLLVQSLLTAERPDVQCFPLSGADGGRDAVEALPEDSKLADAIIYQVKFKEQNPLGTPSAQELYSWITQRLRKEIPSILALHARGATSYMVITNIPITGRLESGLRDRVKQWAADKLSLPTKFWWREDLDARLSRHYDLVFRFGLFTGPDSVREMLEARRENITPADGPIRRSETPTAVLALQAYLADQYKAEYKLRFEQADIHGSPLLDLFVDVPVMMSESELPRSARSSREFWNRHARLLVSSVGESKGLLPPRAIELLYDGSYHYFLAGGADLLLMDGLPDPLKSIVIEGAPGQGKSTLGQYVCQTHRIRLLDKKDDYAKLPESHAKSPIRLPVRVELRHLATWFSGTNPWTSEDMSIHEHSGIWAKSVESFVAAHVRHASGGMNFTVDDAVAILSRTPSFLFLDGLDEVPDVKVRETIVGSVEASLNRLESLGADMKVLVTTRPAIFVKSPGFSHNGFQYLHLTSLTEPLISQYAEAWIRVRDLSEETVEELREVLYANLKQTHVAELARNPMQLAILLYLISVKGRSLPDQRTALYEQYLTAFLDREARKSRAVEAYRKPLLQLHGFLGWLLHSRAESHDSKYTAGDISLQELRDVFQQYLRHQERSTDLIDELFEGAERVFVLVARNVGRFEFEVQPLREFFAARYLYKTAPHSTSAQPQPGARPRRLEELLRNPYWLNVARFFCGWYDEGELADLTRHVQDLFQDRDYKYLGHPRYLINYILQDCTPAESPRDVRILVNAMTDPLGLRLLAARNSWGENDGRRSSAALLPQDCGLDLFIERLREAYLSAAVYEQVLELAQAIRENDSSSERSSWWLSLQKKAGWSDSEWLPRGVHIDAIAHIPLSVALDIFEPSSSSDDAWARCIEAGRFDVGLHDAARFARLKKMLAAGVAPLPFSGKCTSAGRLIRLPLLFGMPRLTLARRQKGLPRIKVEESAAAVPESMKSLVKPLDDLVLLAADLHGERSPRTLLQHIDGMLQALDEIFGESWLAWRMALVGGTVPGFSVKSRAGFSDTDAGLLKRARAAKLSSSDLSFWMESASGDCGSAAYCMAVFAGAIAWADPDVLAKVLPQMSEQWAALSPREILEVCSTAVHLMDLSGVGRNASKRISEQQLSEMAELPSSMACALYWRTEESADPLLVRRIVASFSDSNDTASLRHASLVASFLTGYSLLAPERSGNWQKWCNDIRTYYLANTDGKFWGIGTPDWLLEVRRSPQRRATAVRDMWNLILGAPNDYPSRLLAQADSEASAAVAAHLLPLREIAAGEGWFQGLPQ